MSHRICENSKLECYDLTGPKFLNFFFSRELEKIMFSTILLYFGPLIFLNFFVGKKVSSHDRVR